MTSSYAEYIDPSKTPQAELQSARILFGAALAHTPAELYDYIERPDFEPMPQMAEIAILEQAPTAIREKSTLAKERRLLTAGISDVGEAMQIALSHHTGLSLDEAIAIGSHPRTIDFIASAARTNQTATTSILAHGILSDDGLAIVQNPDFHPAAPALPRQALYSGCPVARSEHSRTEAQPVFKSFVPWAAELSLRAIYQHRSTQNA